MTDEEKLQDEKLKDRLMDIQIQLEKDMQAVANQLTDLNEKYQKDSSGLIENLRHPFLKSIKSQICLDE